MDIILLCIAFFPISIVGVSTGGLSLLTVPILILAGLPPHQAVATNMLGLVFLSLSGVAGFASQIRETKPLLIFNLSLLTALASFGGAFLVLSIDENLLQRVIAVVIITVILFVILNPSIGLEERFRSRRRRGAGWIAAGLLGIYGGFFSGAYITMLTYVFIFFWGMSFLRAAGITKVLNFFSSGAACIYFFSSGAINFRYGIPLSAAMFAGGYLGARIAVFKGSLWLRRIFLMAAAVTGITLLARQL